MIYIRKESYTIFHQFLFQNVYIRLKIGCQLLSNVKNYDNNFLVLVELSTDSKLNLGNNKLSSSDGILGSK